MKREAAVQRALGTARAQILAAVLATATMAGAGGAALAKDYMVTTSMPNNLYLIDLEARKIVKNCSLPGTFAPGVIQMSPDNKVAYVLKDRWENVYGIEVDSCKVVFRAVQSTEQERVKTIGAMTVSADGKEIYTIQSPVKLLKDRMEVQAPRFAVFDAAAGLNAKPIRTYPAPRRVSIMATAKDGTVYMGGHDIYAFDPKSGKLEVAIANANWDRPTYSPPDVLAFWPVGSVSREFLLMYTAAKFTDASQQEIADYVWGYSRVDLDTGKTAIDDFASIEVLMFSAVTHPKNKDILFGVYSQLSKHDLKNDKLIKRVDLDHTYYCINIATDGSEVYVGGTNDDIAIYDPETLQKIGAIMIPGGGDMSTATVQVFKR